MNPVPDKNIEVFNEDIRSHSAYIYASNTRLSMRYANKRSTDASLALYPFAGKKVIDIGCGDGTFTIELFDHAKPASILGCDGAEEAIRSARQKIDDRKITFETANAYSLPFPDDSFDVAYVRAILHHLDHPGDAIREAFRVARDVLIVEPNGYNPVLKLLEKIHPYHIAHKEKSYTSRMLDRLVREAGGKVLTREWFNLVPMFCPDWIAKASKLVEPLVERTPGLRLLGCSLYGLRATREAQPR